MKLIGQKSIKKEGVNITREVSHVYIGFVENNFNSLPSTDSAILVFIFYGYFRYVSFKLQ